MNKKKIVYIDMDGVLVDLQSNIDKWLKNHSDEENAKYIGNHDLIPGIFRNPKPIAGAIEAIKKLQDSGKYELIIATTAPWDCPVSNTDKRYWIETYFGDLFKRQMIITHRKDLLYGDYLIDDRLANGSEFFKGELLHFGINQDTKQYNTFPDWDSVLKKLL